MSACLSVKLQLFENEKIRKMFMRSSVAGRPVAPAQPVSTHHARCAAGQAGPGSPGFSGGVDASFEKIVKISLLLIRRKSTFLLIF